MPTKSQIRSAMIEELKNEKTFPIYFEDEILEILDSALSRLPDLPDEKPSGEYYVPVSVEERLPEEEVIFLKNDGSFLYEGFWDEMPNRIWLEKRTFPANVTDEEINKAAWENWEENNQQLHYSGGVNPHAFVLGYKVGFKNKLTSPDHSK